MEHTRSAYLRFTSAELKERLADYNKAVQILPNEKTRDSMHQMMNVMIDILKERNEL
jgi:hypothetical protein